MSNPLQITYAHQLDALVQQMHRDWVWPSPGNGFALHVFQAPNASLPFEAGSLLLSDVDKRRFDQAPVLASIGYSMTLPTVHYEDALLRAWAEGLERISARAAFPNDRQSFAYRPIELFGIVLGALHCDYATDATKDWLRHVLIDGESKIAGGSVWDVLLSGCAAHSYSVIWKIPASVQQREMTAQELGLICWLGTAYPEFAASASVTQKNVATELSARCAMTLLSALDTSEAAVLYFALHQAVQNLLSVSPASMGTTLPIMKSTTNQNNKPAKVKILFLAANPFVDNHLALDEEIRSIKEKIRASTHRDLIEIVSEWAVRPDDLIQALNEHKPDIVHFSGHGSAAEEIFLSGNDGSPKPVPKSALVQLFKTLAGKIQVVVLNACYSQAQAAAIIEQIPCAIGMNTSIGDEAAIAFASSFYRALGFGQSVKNAFDQGVLSLLMESILEENTPELLTKESIDATRIILINAADAIGDET